MTKHVILQSSPETLRQEKLREVPEAWEDGRRVPSQPGYYERWHFDVCLEDGTILLVTFYNKPLFERSAALAPGVSVNLIQPNGKKILQVDPIDPEDYTASRERCYVRAGKSWVRGDSAWNYELDVQAGDLAAHLNLTSAAPPWRPGSGKFAVEGDENRFFSWLAPIPSGTVEGLLTWDGKMRPVKGNCYHDHRWGNAELNRVFSHWYIGRARLGETTLVFLEMTSAPQYGQEKLPALLVIEGNRTLISSVGGDAGTGALELVEEDFKPDEGGRSYPAILHGCWEVQPDSRVRFTLGEPQPIDSFSLVDFLPTIKRLAGGLLSNPYQFTLSTELDFEIFHAGKNNREKGQAICELALLR